ncbi:hypothetical protein [Acetobacter sp. DsW_063]|uniref:hypothetical protein n=1 Tax=Acetobacter sp. DsW_063 TaxID=1514894 RepID=UPI000A39289B|nr:hypothetical protein [Acetobacter sp. DsW_063]OUJ16725.1 hypothetical protein HK28_09220 [Acetobacter sp. DsW_063]
MVFSDDAIEHLAHRLLDYSLPKHEWTHEAHFAATLWLLRKRPELTTPDALRALITTYNDATNTPNTDVSGYHHTITQASLRGARHHLTTHAPETPLHILLGHTMASPLGRSDWLLSYWTRPILFSPVARRTWVDPDFSALPF